MKTNRTDLNSEYEKLIQGSEKFWPENYEPHGSLTECNFGGLVVTLDNTGEAVFLVRDYGDEFVYIEGEFEIEYQSPEICDQDPENYEPDELLACFEYNNYFYSLDNFMRI